MPQNGRPVRPSPSPSERPSAEPSRISGTRFIVEDVDLTPEQQQRISDLFIGLAERNLYDLLEVPREADKKTIKRAYNAMVVALHPDRFFRKRLGTFKPKMEAIIERMTEAHDILCAPDRRAAYDAALQTNRPSVIDGMLAEAMKEMASSTAGRYEILDIQDFVEVRTKLPRK